MIRKRGIETLFISILLIGTVFGGVVYGDNDKVGRGDDTGMKEAGIYGDGEREVSEVSKDSILTSFSASSTYFTENKGQFPDEVLFQAHVSGATVYLCRDSVVSVFTREINISGENDHEDIMRDSVTMDREPPEMEVLSVVTRFVNASSTVVVAGGGLLPHRNNYFMGNDPSKWYVDVPNYQAVLYKNIYSGIDLRYYSHQGSLKYDFIAQPGVDPSVIKMEYEGIENVEMTPKGDLEISTRLGVLSEKEPVMYQEKDGARVQIRGGYGIMNDNIFGFTIQGEYDQTCPLIIDPELVYSTYLGGTSSDYGMGVAVDGAGNTIITGDTWSSNFPMVNPIDGTHNGGGDAFVAKLSPSGSLLYNTYLGGTNNDIGWNVAVDGGGNAYITGYTYSSNFPVVNPCDSTYNGNGDAFVTKLSTSGNSILYSTYLGGTKYDYGVGVAVDWNENAYITGWTESSNFPVKNSYDNTYNGNGDAFVTKLSTSGNSILYSTYLGGTKYDYGVGVAVDGNENAYITGWTESSNFPVKNAYDSTYNGNLDSFVTKLSPTGNSILYSTYLGGAGRDWSMAIAVDGGGNACITGGTYSGSFPLVNPYDSTYNGGGDVFVAKLSPNGNYLLYSTYLGGTNHDYGMGIAVDGGGNAYITGNTSSNGFPMVNPYDGTYNGGINHGDAFVAKLSTSGSNLLYSTYLGGTSEDYGIGVAVDTSGNIYITGGTSSNDFPQINPHDGTHNGNWDIFVTKLSITLPTGNTLYVGGNGPGNYTTIQSAIDAASNGNTIFVYIGIYHENIIIYKNGITLLGENKNSTIIDGNIFGDVVFISADWVNLSGFTIKNSGSDDYNAGISLSSFSSNNTITGNTIIYNNRGIWLSGSSNNTITGNTITNNTWYGIMLWYSSNNNNITGNSITHNTYDGIYLYYGSGSNTVTGNTITNNSNGIYLYYGSGNTVTGNSITHNNCGIVLYDSSNNNVVTGNTITYNNNYGIWLWSSNDNAITGNSFFHCGLYVQFFSFQNSVTDNTVNGKPLVYLEGQFNVIIDDSEAGQIILVNCTNVTIKNQELSNTTVAIELVFTDNCFIMGNTITHNNDGIVLYYSGNNTIMGNTITHNNDGIVLYDSSNNNVVTGNTITNNTWYGIMLWYSSNNTTITGNTITNNTWYGIMLWYSSNNTITGNTIIYNNRGIWLYDSSNNNKIYHNNFINNTNYQAYDNEANIWDDDYPSGGNYWNGYDGFDNYHGPNQDIPGSDGIGDTPYDVTGGDNQDRYPLIEPYRFDHMSCLDLTLSTDKANYSMGEIVNISLKVTNICDSWVNLSTGSYAWDFEIANETGSKIYCLWGDKIYLPTLYIELNWPPLGTLYFNYSWNQTGNNCTYGLPYGPVPPGDYVITGWLNLLYHDMFLYADPVTITINTIANRTNFDQLQLPHNTQVHYIIYDQICDGTTVSWKTQRCFIALKDDDGWWYSITPPPSCPAWSWLDPTVITVGFEDWTDWHYDDILLHIKKEEKASHAHLHIEEKCAASTCANPTSITFLSNVTLSYSVERSWKSTIEKYTNKNVTLQLFPNDGYIGHTVDIYIELADDITPLIYNLEPQNGTIIGATNTTISWKTQQNATSEVFYKAEDEETYHHVTGAPGIYHHVQISNLTRNKNYLWYVQSQGPNGTALSEIRTLTVSNGLIFTQDNYFFTVERDYNQQMNIKVQNTDNVSHDLLVRVNNPHDDLVTGFVGNGSMDQIISLSPGETRDVQLVIHAQDVEKENYTFTVNLTTLGGEYITDVAVVHIQVRWPNIDFQITEVSMDPVTLVKRVKVTNYGDPVTDLRVYALGDIKNMVIFNPTIDHLYLGTGQSAQCDVIPVFQGQSLGACGIITAEAAAATANLSTCFNCQPGKMIYVGMIPHVDIQFSPLFDTDESPNTNPFGTVLVESYLVNGSLVFVSQIIVDVYQNGKPVYDANVSLTVWTQSSEQVLYGVSDIYGKVYFTLYGPAQTYSYRAGLVGYGLTTESRTFSVNSTPLYELFPRGISWVNVSDSNSTFMITSGYNSSVVLDSVPFTFTGTLDSMEENTTVFLFLQWDEDVYKQIAIPGTVEGNIISCTTSAIPVGNYTGMLIALSPSGVSFSQSLHVICTDEDAIYQQQNYSFWTPFPVNATHMITLSIDHRVLSAEPTMVLDLHDIRSLDLNNSQYQFTYVVVSNETLTDSVTIEARDGYNHTLYSYTGLISLMKETPSYINISLPVHYTNGSLIQRFTIRVSVGSSTVGITVQPVVHPIADKYIWVGSDWGIFEFFYHNQAGVFIKCGAGIFLDAVIPGGGLAIGLLDIMHEIDEDDYYEANIVASKVAVGEVVLKLYEKIGVKLGIKEASKLVPILGGIGGCILDWYDVYKEQQQNKAKIGSIGGYHIAHHGCLNKPNFEGTFHIPSTVTEPGESAYIIVHLTSPPGNTYHSFDTNVIVNGHVIGTIEDTVPNGHYIFEFDPLLLHYSTEGVSANSIVLDSPAMNRGYYISSSGVDCVLLLNQVQLAVCAESQSEADNLLASMSGAMEPGFDFGVYPEDIYFSNTNPVGGDQVTITVRVFNFGIMGVYDVPIEFFDNGVPIAMDQSLGYVPMMGAQTINLTWNAAPGSHTILVKINGDHVIPELDYTNNEASRSIVVSSGDVTPPVVENVHVSLTSIPEDTDGVIRVCPGNPVCSEVTNISVTVKDSSQITSVILDLSSLGWSSITPMTHLMGTDMWYVRVSAKPGSALHNGSGYVSRHLLFAATDVCGNQNTTTVSITMWKNGDVNGDGAITLYDATYIAKWYFNQPDFEYLPENVADVSGDCQITLYDATYLAKWYFNQPGFEVIK